MNESTKFHLGLIGFPLEHSFSPILHAAAFESCGLEGNYTLFPIPPLPDGKKMLIDLLQQVRSGEIQGINVTIPHKQNVIPLLDHLTESAQEIGAVNTVYLKNGQLMGHNTDAGGFMKDLTQKLSNQPQQRLALVLGAGGSSRAITYALNKNGWQVMIAARRPEQAEELRNSFSGKNDSITACALTAQALKDLTPELIVNTTPVGMFPNTETSPWPAQLAFPNKAFVYDLVYNPAETLLVKQAKAAGLPASNGLGMLVEQAALSFERWIGQVPSRNAMTEAAASRFEPQEKNKENPHGT